MKKYCNGKRFSHSLFCFTFWVAEACLVIYIAILKNESVMASSVVNKENVLKNVSKGIHPENKKFPVKLKEGQVKEDHLTNEIIDECFAEIKKSNGQVIKFYKGIGGDNLRDKTTELKIKGILFSGGDFDFWETDNSIDLGRIKVMRKKIN